MTVNSPVSRPLNILVIGATSAIARATARLYAAQGENLHLVARNKDFLKATADDLSVRGAGQVTFTCLDLNETERHDACLKDAFDNLEQLDIALICHGTLPDQQAAEKDFELVRQAVDTNGLSVISLLMRLGERLRAQGHGTLAVVTSVAGDRGRQSNYVYGAAKALVSTFTEGLRGRLLQSNVHVVDIRPGLVDTPMTAHLEKGLLWSQPERIGAIIVKAIRRKQHTVYAPFYWRFIMSIVRAIPAPLLKRMKF